MTIKTYTELIQHGSFLDRFRYLKLGGSVGRETFGYDRYLNQRFYRSKEWRDIRFHVIVRDNGCDLAADGYDIHGGLLIHHMNPITMEQLWHGDESILDPEYLITTRHATHNAIHYGDESLLLNGVVERQPWDTVPWKMIGEPNGSH